MGWKSDELLIVLRKPVGGNTNGGKKKQGAPPNVFLERCGPQANYGNHDQSAQQQSRPRRRRSRSVSEFSVAGLADPGRGTERLSERLFSRRPAS